MEVSPEFDLDHQYYRHQTLASCQGLCASLPACRSFSYHSTQSQCVLKAATCLEAGLGAGCYWVKGDGSAMHADKTTTYGFVAAAPDEFILYIGISETQPYSTAAQLCKSAGFELAVVRVQAVDQALTSAWQRHTTAVGLATQDGWAGWLDSWLPSEGYYFKDGKWSPYSNAPAPDEEMVPGEYGVPYRPSNVTKEGDCTAQVAAPDTPIGSVWVGRNCSQPLPFTCKALLAVRPARVMWAGGTTFARWDRRLAHSDTGGFCIHQVQSDGLAAMDPHGRGGSDPEVYADWWSQSMMRAYTRSEHEVLWDAAQETPDVVLLEGFMVASAGGATASTYWRWGIGPLSADPALLSPDDQSPPSQNCMATKPPPSASGMPRLTSVDCSSTGLTMCTLNQYGPGQMAPARLRLYRGRAMAFFARAQTYYTARAHCRSLGGWLVSVHDADMEAFLVETWLSLDPLSNYWITAGRTQRPLGWLGAASSSGAQNAQWDDGTPWDFQPLADPMFRRGPRGICAVMYIGPDGAPVWRRVTNEAGGADGDCYTHVYNYTCNLAAAPVLQPSGIWLDVQDNSEYELHFSAPLTAQDARSVCQARGGDLASVHSARVFDALALQFSRLQNELWGGKPMTQRVTGSVLLGGAALGDGRHVDQWWWLDGTPYDFRQWAPSRVPSPNMTYPLYPEGAANLCLGMQAIAGDVSLAALRCSHNHHFVCRVQPSPSLGAAEADDVTYQAFGAPRAATFHQAQRLCMALGGNLATLRTAHQASVVSGLCSAAIAALPTDGTATATAPSACWVGYYCPGGNETKAHTGFDIEGAEALARQQPLLLRPAGCSSPGHFLALDGSSVAAAGFSGAAQLNALAAAAPASPACVSLQSVNSSNDGGPSLQLIDCTQSAVYVCALPSSEQQHMQQALHAAPTLEAADAGASSAPPGAYAFVGCYASSLDPKTQAQAAAPLPYFWPSSGGLPLLAAVNATSLEQCYSLARRMGLTHFALGRDGACTGALGPPGPPYYRLSGGSADNCSGSAVHAIEQPLQADGSEASTSLPAGAPNYLCMQGYMVSGHVVGRLHMRDSELFSCRAACDLLLACHAYIWDEQRQDCLLVDSGLDALADAQLFDAAWAGQACISVARIVPGASLQQLGAASEWHICASRSVSLASAATRLLSGLLGDAAMSPYDRLPVVDLSACADSCAANRTCTAIALGPPPPAAAANASAVCYTRRGIPQAATATIAPSPWLALSPLPRMQPPSDASVAPQQACLPLRRLALPPVYVCEWGYEVSGTYLSAVDSSEAGSCRAACTREPMCLGYVLFTNGTCSLRGRVFYMQPAVSVGTTGRSSLAELSCVHSGRLGHRYGDHDVALTPYYGLYGPDNNYHACYPYIEFGGAHYIDVPGNDPETCLTACFGSPMCTFSTISVSSVSASCRLKKRPTTFTSNTNQGSTRLDLWNTRETCFNLDRLLPWEGPAPTWVCRRAYALPMVTLYTNTTCTEPSADACEAACASDARCGAYTWAAHDSSCILGAQPFSGADWGPAAAGTLSGPNVMASQTCVHVPRMVGGSDAVYLQANGVWHYCNTTALPDSFFGPGMVLVGAVKVVEPSRWLWECSATCRAHPTCQLFVGVAGAGDAGRTSDNADRCMLYALQPLSYSAAGGSSSGGIMLPGVALTQVCIMVDAPSLLRTASAGMTSPSAAPLELVYRSKQYSLYRSSLLTYAQASSVCQARGAGSQLASLVSPQELQVVRELMLRPATGGGELRLQPAPGEVLQPAAFWFGLQPDGSYSHGREANATFVSEVLMPAAGSSSGACMALTLGAAGSVTVAGDCHAWQLPFICETPLEAANGNSSGASSSISQLQVLPRVAAGLPGARQLATTAGSVLASLDLSSLPLPQRQRRSLVQSGGRYTFGSLLEATQACAGNSAGCWVLLAARPAQCGPDGTAAAAAPVCTASGGGLLVGGPPPSNVEAEVAEALLAAGAAASVCMQALCTVTAAADAATSSNSSGFEIRATPCSRSGGALLLPVDPDLPLRMSAQPPLIPTPSPPVPAQAPVGAGEAMVGAAPSDGTSGSDSSGGSSSSAVIGAAVGGAVGGAVVLLGIAGLMWRRARVQRKEAAAESKMQTQDKDTPTDPGAAFAERSKGTCSAPATSATGGPMPAFMAVINTSQNSSTHVEPLESGAGSGSSLAQDAFSADVRPPGPVGTADNASAGHGSLQQQPEAPELAAGASSSGEAVVSHRLAGSSNTTTGIVFVSNGNTHTQAAASLGSSGSAAGAAQPSLSPASPDAPCQEHAASSEQQQQQQQQQQQAVSHGGVLGRVQACAAGTVVVTVDDEDIEGVRWDMDPSQDIEYDTDDLLGKGTFGAVYRGSYRGRPVAVKVAMRGAHGALDTNSAASLLHEAHVLGKVRHPNIVACYGGCVNEENVFLVEDLMEGSLASLIDKSPRPLPLLSTLKVALDIATGLFHLHPTIIHRDLKPDNILISKAGVAKISDFGLARFQMSSHMANTETPQAGTMAFMAPECFSGDYKSITYKADIFSLAVIIWVMLTKQVPWRGYHYAAIVFKVVVQGERLALPDDPVVCPPTLARLIGRMWAAQASQRPGAGEVLKALALMLHRLQCGGLADPDGGERAEPAAEAPLPELAAQGLQGSD